MQEKALFGSFYGSSLSSNNPFHSKNNQNSISNGANNLRANHVETTTTLTWAFQAVPTLYSVYQKVDK